MLWATFRSRIFRMIYMTSCAGELVVVE